MSLYELYCMAKEFSVLLGDSRIDKELDVFHNFIRGYVDYMSLNLAISNVKAISSFYTNNRLDYLITSIITDCMMSCYDETAISRIKYNAQLINEL